MDLIHNEVTPIIKVSIGDLVTDVNAPDRSTEWEVQGWDVKAGEVTLFPLGVSNAEPLTFTEPSQFGLRIANVVETSFYIVASWDDINHEFYYRTASYEPYEGSDSFVIGEKHILLVEVPTHSPVELALDAYKEAEEEATKEYVERKAGIDAARRDLLAIQYEPFLPEEEVG